MKSWLYNSILFIIIVCCFPLQAQHQRVTLEGNLTFEEIFRSIEKQTGAIISYNRSRLNTNQPVTIFQANSPLETILLLVLENTGFTYRLKYTGQLHILIIPEKSFPHAPVPTVSLPRKQTDTGTYPAVYPQPATPVMPPRSSPQLTIPTETLLQVGTEGEDYLYHPLQSAYIHRFSVVQLHTGSSISRIPFRVQFRKSPEYNYIPYQASLYSHAQVKIVPRFTISPAISAHYFSLNRNLYIEPRLQLLWKVVSGHTLALGYGIQARQGYTHHYKPWWPGMPDKPVHPQLLFTKTHHIAATYQWQPASGMRIEAGGEYSFIPRHRFMVKVLAGRDWHIKPDGSQTLSTNLRVVWLGGNRNVAAGEVPNQELLAANPEDLQDKVMRNAPVVETGLTLNYRISQQRVTHDFSVKILTTNFVKKNLYPFQVRVEKGEPVREPAVVSNVSYQITF